MGFDTVFLFILSFGIVLVDGNTEGDILHNWRTTLDDPNNVLQSWDPTLVNPCTWFHITCNLDNIVVRVDLGNAGLSGPISPLLGNLTNLQYLELFDNSFKGEIPATLGELKRLISLDLYENKLSGSIPATLGNLKLLRFLRLNGNALTGDIPAQVLNLIPRGSLEILNVSNNLLAGRKPAHSKDLVITTIIQDPRA